MDRIKEYREALAKFCKGDVVMSIPTQPNDADIVLNECIDRLEGILQDTRQKKMKLTIIYTGCGQVGIDEWTNYHKTKVIELTEEQKEQIKPPNGMTISNVIFEEE